MGFVLLFPVGMVLFPLLESISHHDQMGPALLGLQDKLLVPIRSTALCSQSLQIPSSLLRQPCSCCIFLLVILLLVPVPVIVLTISTVISADGDDAVGSKDL